jgi:C4-dicarboxylate transporter DctQ subunit
MARGPVVCDRPRSFEEATRRSMNSSLKAIGRRLYRLAEHLLVVMLAVMFAAFVVQVAFRYLFGLPTGWSNELTVVLWIWLVLFGAAFVVREEEEIRFELVYGAVRERTRRFMIVVSALALIALYAWSLPAVADYVSFMHVEHTAYLKIRFDWLYSIYVIFAVATIARYVWLAWSALSRRPVEYDPTKAASGV